VKILHCLPCCASDAADDEGKCLKAEVEILRSHAKRNADALAQLAVESDPMPLQLQARHTAACLQGGNASQMPFRSTEQQQQQQPEQQLLHCSEQSRGVMQSRQPSQQQQGSGCASEMELAAVEEGLSALEQQITAAALRCG